MAPPRLYQSPLEQLSDLLSGARASGFSFDEAWELAVRPGKSIVMTTTPRAPADAIRWPTDRNDRLAWQAAIGATREAWRRSYERIPATAGDRAVVLLAVEMGRGMEWGAVVPFAA